MTRTFVICPNATTAQQPELANPRDTLHECTAPSSRRDTSEQQASKRINALKKNTSTPTWRTQKTYHKKRPLPPRLCSYSKYQFSQVLCKTYTLFTIHNSGLMSSFCGIILPHRIFLALFRNFVSLFVLATGIMHVFFRLFSMTATVPSSFLNFLSMHLLSCRFSNIFQCQIKDSGGSEVKIPLPGQCLDSCHSCHL